jgi:hypothetical protein
VNQPARAGQLPLSCRFQRRRAGPTVLLVNIIAVTISFYEGPFFLRARSRASQSFTARLARPNPGPAAMYNLTLGCLSHVAVDKFKVLPPECDGWRSGDT